MVERFAVQKDGEEETYHKLRCTREQRSGAQASHACTHVHASAAVEQAMDWCSVARLRVHKEKQTPGLCDTFGTSAASWNGQVAGRERLGFTPGRQGSSSCGAVRRGRVSRDSNPSGVFDAQVVAAIRWGEVLLQRVASRQSPPPINCDRVGARVPWSRLPHARCHLHDQGPASKRRGESVAVDAAVEAVWDGRERTEVDRVRSSNATQ